MDPVLVTVTIVMDSTVSTIERNIPSRLATTRERCYLQLEFVDYFLSLQKFPVLQRNYESCEIVLWGILKAQGGKGPKIVFPQ
jgi:hypothetical protein